MYRDGDLAALKNWCNSMYKRWVVPDVVFLSLMACGQVDVPVTDGGKGSLRSEASVATSATDVPTAPTVPKQGTTHAPATSQLSITVGPTTDARNPVFKGIQLPAGLFRKAHSFDAVLPPAWLVAGGQATPGTFGSYTVSADAGGGMMQAEHADAIEPQRMDNLASMRLPAGVQSTIVLKRYHEVKDLRATVRPWANVLSYEVASQHALVTTSEPAGDLIGFILEPIVETADQLLEVTVSWDNGDSTNYLWRLNPEGGN